MGKEKFFPSWFNKRTCLHYGETGGNVYCFICKNAAHYNIMNDIRVKQDILTGNMQEVRKRFSSTWILKLLSTSYPKTDRPNSTEDLSEMVKNNLTEVQSQNRASLKKIISCLGYLKDYLYVEMLMTKILILNNS